MPRRVRPRSYVAVPATLVPVLLLGVPDPAPAQDTTPVELQETHAFPTGARAMGMGSAFVAVSDDVSGFAYNPAGLVQLKQLELAGGLDISDPSRTVTRNQTNEISDSSTRFGYLAVGGAQVTPQGTVGYAFGFRRYRDLNESYFSEGLLLAPTPTLAGIYGVDSYMRNGAINAWTGALAFGFGTVSVGGSLSYLTGSSQENILNANYRAEEVNGDLVLDTGLQVPDDAAYQETIYRYANVYGWTGSLGLMVFADENLRLGGVIDFETGLHYDGNTNYRLEDWEKIDRLGYYFADDMTLPISLKGGAAYRLGKLLLSGEVNWTDYKNIDYGGKILAPSQSGSFQPVYAYRSVVAWNVGAELTTSEVLTLRGGVFGEPLPYSLIAADTDFYFTPADTSNPDDYSVVYRDYPQATITSDGLGFSAGASVVVGRAMSLDVAYSHTSWERTTNAGYQNSTPYYPTEPTTESLDENRFYMSTTFRFQ